jgi:hypothetical protein
LLSVRVLAESIQQPAKTVGPGEFILKDYAAYSIVIAERMAQPLADRSTPSARSHAADEPETLERVSRILVEERDIEIASPALARQKSKLAGTIRGSYFVVKGEYWSEVREKGLEPSRLSAQVPKTCVYTNFTTPASAHKV